MCISRPPTQIQPYWGRRKLFTTVLHYKTVFLTQQAAFYKLLDCILIRMYAHAQVAIGRINASIEGDNIEDGANAVAQWRHAVGDTEITETDANDMEEAIEKLKVRFNRRWSYHLYSCNKLNHRPGCHSQ